MKCDRIDSQSFRPDPTAQISPYACQSHQKSYHLAWLITPPEPQRCTYLAHNQERQDIICPAVRPIPANHINKLNFFSLHVERLEKASWAERPYKSALKHAVRCSCEQIWFQWEGSDKTIVGSVALDQCGPLVALHDAKTSWTLLAVIAGLEAFFPILPNDSKKARGMTSFASAKKLTINESKFKYI